MVEEDKEKFFLRDIEGDRLDFGKMFGNERPVHIEIGCGRGEFLAEISRLEPEVNFLGLEIKQKRIKSILQKLDPEEHDNIRLLHVKVDKEMMKLIPDGTVGRLYIFHPDPWPKKRHFKHRLIQEEYLGELSRIMIQGGDVLITTDHEDYMRWIVDMFAGNADFTPVYPEEYSREPFSGHIETHFEKKLKQKGFPPYYMRFIKR